MQTKRSFKFTLSLALIATIFVAPFSLTGRAQIKKTIAAPQTQNAMAPDQTAKLAAIEKKLEERRQALGVTGASLAIVKDDKVIYAKGFGFKDYENKVPVTPDTVFAIGSVTKSFTGMTALMSQDEGKLSIDDSPKKYLPYFKLQDPDADAKITVRDLLSHSSGLNRTDIAMITGKLNRVELIKLLAEVKPTAKLREKFQYQNIMFSAAGEVVAAAQKSSWEDFVETRIFKPLSMNNSYTSISAMSKAKDAAFGYDYNADTKETRRVPYRDIPFSAAAGSITSSVRDMGQWVRFMLNGGVIDGKRLVSEKSFKESISPQMKIANTVSYGLGWILRDWRGISLAEHGGSIDGFNSKAAFLPDKKIGLMLLTNVSNSPLTDEVIEIVFSNLVGEDKPKSAPDNSPVIEVEKLFGKYKFVQAGFDLEVINKDGRLVASVPNQPQYALERVSGNRYKLPIEGYFVTFRPATDDEKDLEIYLEQPQGNYVLPRAKAGETAVPVKSADAYRELVGSYQFEKKESLKAEIEIKDGALTLTVPSQPIYTLIEKNKDTFNIKGLREIYSVKVRRGAEGKVTSLVFVQPEGVFLYKRAADAPKEPIAITADELMAKAIKALGGEANLRKHKTLITTFNINLENQGVKGSGTNYAKAPNMNATNVKLTALDKEIGTIWEYFDGRTGATEISFAPVQKYTGKRLANAAITSDFYGLLNWKTLFKTAEIKRKDKIGDEEVYVLVMTPENGTPVTAYFSTKSFLLLRRDSFEVTSDASQLQLPVTETFSDYRSIDGVMVPFKSVSNTITNGDVVVTLKDAKFNADVPDATFRSQPTTASAN